LCEGRELRRRRRGEEEEEEEGEEELEKRKNFWVAGSGGSHATKERLGVIECLEVGGANMAKNFEKISAKKEREVGASNLIKKIWVRNLKMGFDPLKGVFFYLDFFLKKIRHKGYEKQGVYHTMALPFTLKRIILRQKERIMETHKYFTMPKYNLPKKKIL